MSERIAIDADVIAYHARRVDNVASDIHTAVDAAQSMNMAGGAFGVMCAFLVPPAVGVAAVATEALASAERMLERSAEALRDGVSDFASHEDDVVSEISTFRQALEGSVG